MGLKHTRWARRKEPKCVSWTYKPPAHIVLGFILQPTWKCPRDQNPLVGFIRPLLDMALNHGRRRNRVEGWSTGVRGWWERLKSHQRKRCSSEPAL
jgi:hypothetical protein